MVMEATSETRVRGRAVGTSDTVCWAPAYLPGSFQPDGAQTSPPPYKGTEAWPRSPKVEIKVQRGQATHSGSHSI